MGRVESIKERHRKDEVEYTKVSKGLVHEDRGYLLQRLERYENGLKKILDHGDDRPDCYPLYNIAEEALKEDDKE